MKKKSLFPIIPILAIIILGITLFAIPKSDVLSPKTVAKKPEKAVLGDQSTRDLTDASLDFNIDEIN